MFQGGGLREIVARLDLKYKYFLSIFLTWFADD